ncbi:MAG: aspartate kinase [Cyanobacteria bacterium J06639_1]
MALIVQKYGGTSVGSTDRIRKVAERVAATVRDGHQVVVVVSAMGKDTDRLMNLANDIAPPPQSTPHYCRELDMLLSSGEQVSIALLAMALQQLDCPAVSMTGAQVGILTEREHTRARIIEINPDRLLRHLNQGKVVVVAGFQGISSLVDLEITTLGRGGSDTSAVALAVALEASACEIYTDVPGILTTDPRLVPEAQLLAEIDSSEMLELASLGAQVLHPRAVEIARNYGMKLVVRSSMSDAPGTAVLSALSHRRPPVPSSRSVLTGIELAQAVDAVTVDRAQAKIALLRVPDRPGIAAQLFEAIAAADINVDLILQSVHASASGDASGLNDIAFTLESSQSERAGEVAEAIAQALNAEQTIVDAEIAKVSISGAGMIGRPGIAAEMFEVLGAAGINIQMISMSEIKVSCTIASDRASDAALQLSQHFQIVPFAVADVPAEEPISGSYPVRGVALDRHQSRLAILHVPDLPGNAAKVFRRLAEAGVGVDTIVQSQSLKELRPGSITNDIAFTTSSDQAHAAAATLRAVSEELGCGEVVVDEAIAKVSVVGAQMEDHPGTAARMFQALAGENINIEMISTSEIKVSCVVPVRDGEKALQAIHRAFRLDAISNA